MVSENSPKTPDLMRPYDIIYMYTHTLVGLEYTRQQHLFSQYQSLECKKPKLQYITPLDVKRCICHFITLHIYPFMSKGLRYYASIKA